MATTRPPGEPHGTRLERRGAPPLVHGYSRLLLTAIHSTLESTDKRADGNTGLTLDVDAPRFDRTRASCGE